MKLVSHRPLCTLCRHLEKPGKGLRGRGRITCSAFPDGIPDDILYYGFDHRLSFANEAVLFEPVDADAAELIQEWQQDVEINDLALLMEVFRFG